MNLSLTDLIAIKDGVAAGNAAKVAKVIDDLVARERARVDAELKGMPFDLLEQLADAILAAPTRNASFATFVHRDEALSAAGAALAMLRTPTDAMVKAGVEHALRDSVSSANGGWPGYIRRLYAAMMGAR